MSSTHVLTTEDLAKAYPAPRSLGDVLRRRPAREVRAVSGVNLSLSAGEVLAIVGESGCGKTTTANLLVGLETPTAGRVVIDGQEVGALDRAGLRRLRRHVQVVFQDPYEALNPRRTIRETVAESLRVHRLARGDEQARVEQALHDAGLTPPGLFLDRLPHELSGGQRQRVCIAGALVLRPKILVADEPVSMLDVSTRAEILNLLSGLAAEQGVAVVMISHDLATVAAYSHRIAVMYLGRVVETGPTMSVLGAPRHPYTQALLSVVPTLGSRGRGAPTVLTGETPDAAALPVGCAFHPRCPVAVDACAGDVPRLHDVAPDHLAACLLVTTRSDREPGRRP